MSEKCCNSWKPVDEWMSCQWMSEQCSNSWMSCQWMSEQCSNSWMSCQWMSEQCNISWMTVSEWMNNAVIQECLVANEWTMYQFMNAC